LVRHRPQRAIVTLADTLVDQYDVIELLNRLAGFAVQLLPADAAGIVLGDARRELRAVAASDEAAHLMELLQLQSDEGPCLDCFQTAAPVGVADLAQAAGRWPIFAAAVAQRGNFRSVHALPLRLRGRAIGALNQFRAVAVQDHLKAIFGKGGRALSVASSSRGCSAPATQRELTG
jgi:hypothetical protein